MKTIVKILIAISLSFNAVYIHGQGLTPKVQYPKYSHFVEFPITQIFPQQWLKEFLLSQKNGLTGHIYAAGYPYNSIGWKGIVKLPKEFEGQADRLWWPYEQTAYWLDGALRCGYLLGDQQLTDTVKGFINFVIDNPQTNGHLGPIHLENYTWPHAVLFRAFMAEYAATGNSEIIEALTRHFVATKEHYGYERNMINIETMCWLYGISGNKEILNIAVKSYETFNTNNNNGDVSLQNLLSDKIPFEHGVTYLESVKIPAILYMFTGNEKYLKASLNGFEKLDNFHMLVDGVPSSSEYLNGKRSNNVHETCDISDYIWSAGYMLMVTGDASWADKIEKACFNAGIGAVTKDFKQFQYYSGPNQIIADNNSCGWNSKESWFEHTRNRMAYRPKHGTECCAGNVNRFMPNYISRMWLTDSLGSITAALYGPSKITVKVGKKLEDVTIVEKTGYPFSETIEFEVQHRNKKGVKFPFLIRIPEWCDNTSISYNGEELKEKIQSNRFFELNKLFHSGDKIIVKLPMKIKPVSTPGNGVAVQRGPLLYSYSIPYETLNPENVKPFVAGFPFLEIKPTGNWEYGLDLNEALPDFGVEVVRGKVSDKPWDASNPPVSLKVPAWKISGWWLENGYTPDLPAQFYKNEKDTITLVPMGATLLRVSIFPDCRKQIKN